MDKKNRKRKKEKIFESNVNKLDESRDEFH
jgi:hypothetical protein